jgi:hypothetical protein
MKSKALSTTVLACFFAAVFAINTLADELAFFSPIVVRSRGLRFIRDGQASRP